MKHLKSKLFSLLTLLCLLLSACGNDAAKPDAEAPTEIDTTSQEAETTEPFIKVTIFENPSEEADEETSAASSKEPEIPSAAPVKDLGELLFERDSVQDVMVVIDRRLFDFLAVPAGEEEREAILDELYGADLSAFEDAAGASIGGSAVQFKLRSGEEEVTLSIYDGMAGISEEDQQYIRLTGPDVQTPLGELKGPKGTFDFNRLSELAMSVESDTEDPAYSGVASIPETGYETKMSKRACGYALYFFDKALEAETMEAPDETVSFDVRMEIGDAVYQLQSETGFFSREDTGGTVYGKLDEDGMLSDGLTVIIMEAGLRSQLNGTLF